MSQTTYIAIRDDAASQSTAERDFIVQTAASGGLILRVDGRKRTERRPVSMTLTRAENLATATVTLGAGTRVTCTVTAELLPPAPDRPNEGSISFAVDISPSASTSYRQATPASTGGGGGRSNTGTGGGPSLPNADRHQKLSANHVLRCLERCLLQGGALDTEALCVVPGAYVWKLSCACTVLDGSGNVTDAAVLACLAAIRHYRKPVVEVPSSSSSSSDYSSSGGSSSGVPVLVPANLKEPTPLPLHHTPLAISFALFDVSGVVAKKKDDNSSSHERGIRSSSSTSTVAVLIDPTAREELCQTGSMTICMNVHAEICLLDFSGGCELGLADLRQCHAQAAAHIGPLCQSLETALEQADQQALTERLAQLQKQQIPLQLPPLPDHNGNNNNYILEEPPFFGVVTDEMPRVVPTDPVGDRAAAARDAATAAAEDAYRRLALDYNVGHVATKVRENKETATAPPRTTTSSTSSRNNNAGSLLAAMLQSVQGGDVAVAATTANAAAAAAALATAHNDNSDDVATPAAVAPMQIDTPSPPPPPRKVDHEMANDKVEATSLPAPIKKQAASTQGKNPSAMMMMMVDSDEEESTMQLQSEFADALPAAPAAPVVEGEGEEDDDLAAAIKSKKKGKKGKTK